MLYRWHAAIFTLGYLYNPFAMKSPDKKVATGSKKPSPLFAPDSGCEGSLIIDCHEHVNECRRLREQLDEQKNQRNPFDKSKLPSLISRLKRPGDYQEIILTDMGSSLEFFYDFLQVVKSIREQGGRVRVLADGLENYHCGQDITPDLEGNIDAITVAMIAQDKETYDRYSDSGVDNAFNQMLNFACGASEFVPDTTLLVIDGLPGVDIDACRRLADSMSVKFKTQSISSLLLSNNH
jgi:TatD family-associated radical SAM protein